MMTLMTLIMLKADKDISWLPVCCLLMLHYLIVAVMVVVLAVYVMWLCWC